MNTESVVGVLLGWIRDNAMWIAIGLLILWFLWSTFKKKDGGGDSEGGVAA